METRFVFTKKTISMSAAHRMGKWLGVQTQNYGSDVGVLLLTRHVTFSDNLSLCDSMTVSCISK